MHPGEIRHEIRHSAAQLVLAGHLGRLDDIPVARVLARIRAAQVRDGAASGNFWWDWEDAKPTDKNAGFFTTIQLLALHYAYDPQLSAAARQELMVLFKDAQVMFRQRVIGSGETSWRYPNAFLGDAVCCWLLAEVIDGVDPDLAQIFPKILAYYHDSPWGWGEHLSDLYVKVIQNELVMLSLYARQLPEASQHLVAELLRGLFDLDATFAGGPRVPAIRNYMLNESPLHAANPTWFKTYHELMTMDDPGHTIATLAARQGLVRQFPPGRATGPLVEVPCAGSAQALALVEKRYRLGVMSQYPLSVDVNLLTHGLHWQSLPVAFWHTAGDWGYLQWLAEEQGQLRSLPHLVRGSGQAYVLSDQYEPARVGQTFGRRREREFLVLRRLPAIAPSWSWCGDRFRLIHPTHGSARTDRVGAWHRLVLPYAEEVLTLAFLPLTGPAAEPALETKAGELHWTVTWAFAGTSRPETIAGLWYLSVGPGPAKPPVVATDAATGIYRLPAPWQADLQPAAEFPWQVENGK